MKSVLIKSFIACVILLCLNACGGGSNDSGEISPEIPGHWDMAQTNIESVLKERGLDYKVRQTGHLIYILVGGADGPHDLIYIFENGLLTKVTRTTTALAQNENNFISQASTFEAEVLTNWNRYDAMDKNLQTTNNVSKSFQIIAHDGKKYATFMCIWFNNKTVQFTVQFFNPVAGEGETLWNHNVKNDTGYMKR